MHRRTLLATTGALTLTSLTGCLGLFTKQPRSPTSFPDERPYAASNAEYLLSIDDFEDTGWQRAEPPRGDSAMFERVDGAYVHVVLSTAEFFGSISMAMTQFADRYDQTTAQNAVELLGFADEGFVYRPRGSEAIAMFRVRNVIGTIRYTMLHSTTADPRSVDQAVAVQYAEKMCQKVVEKLTDEPDTRSVAG